jgi:ribose 5-phosphate isomerase B
VQAVPAPDPKPATTDSKIKMVAIGTDHGGYEMKEALKIYLGELGYTVIDCGTNSKDAVDYPDFALAVAREVVAGKAWCGIVIDGAGIGSCMTANKVPGIRAAMAYDYSSAMNSREHNDANVLTLGAGLIGLIQARTIVKTWLSTDFLGGRHTRRVEKIMAIEKQYLKGEK